MIKLSKENFSVSAVYRTGTDASSGTPVMQAYAEFNNIAPMITETSGIPDVSLTSPNMFSLLFAEAADLTVWTSLIHISAYMVAGINGFPPALNLTLHFNSHSVTLFGCSAPVISAMISGLSSNAKEIQTLASVTKIINKTAVFHKATFSYTSFTVS